MWLTGLAAPWHVGSSQTRARTCVPCIGRQTLNHCATREALPLYFVVKYTQHKIYQSNLLKYTIQWHLAHPECCASITTLYFQNIVITPKVTPYPLSSHSPMTLGHLFRPCSPVLAIINLLSVSMNLPILEISYNGILQYVAFCVWLLLFSIFLAE